MNPNDIVNLYPGLVSIFNSKLDYNINKELAKQNQLCELDITYDKKKKKIVIYTYVDTKKVDVEALNNYYELIILGRRTLLAPIYEFDDRRVIDQIKDIINSINKYNEIVYNNPLEKNNKSVK